MKMPWVSTIMPFKPISLAKRLWALISSKVVFIAGFVLLKVANVIRRMLKRALKPKAWEKVARKLYWLYFTKFLKSLLISVPGL